MREKPLMLRGTYANTYAFIVNDIDKLWGAKQLAAQILATLSRSQWQFAILTRQFFKGNTHYRVGHLLADLGWVDLDLESSQAGGPLL